MQRKFGELLKAHRVKRGATQRQLADLSTVSIRAIRDLESGRAHRPRRDTVRLIADGLGLRGRERADFESVAGSRATADHLRLIYDREPAPPPAPLDALLGREDEVSLVHELLGSGSHRLVTVTGLSGVGKSRLAQEIAAEIHESHGVFVLWSSAADEQDRLADPLAALLRTGTGDTDELAVLIGDRPTLLVLDGHEPAALRLDRVVTLLRECRRLRVLATAHTPFELAGERVFPLAPLAVPEPGIDDLPALAAVPSVRFLLREIRQVQPGFALDGGTAATVAELCRLLDGIPAALEAAACWFLVYEPAAVLDSVRTDPFGLTEDRLPGLRVMLDQAVRGLDATGTSVLVRLTGLDTDWSMTDVIRLTGVPAAVCARLVRRLLLHGLVRPADAGGTRFRALDLVKALHLDRQLAA
ncbi:helix-turn-helix domain-containing protein [Amycolatopsis sp. H20-H5]|uniref:helix-turn-helix domain-containing protein n=1 Tax=Amycolatopsis sp. H20-H5 TaxID=3046309 RepID=UPI002DBF2D6A|nr:helix-turn-helix domain-containing protein [Amycolatopsis sp. H20-H5]MEC3978291.1 helix-turn-helix domain-containing protein [Amycolatopsis sp. H20-H5]